MGHEDQYDQNTDPVHCERTKIGYLIIAIDGTPLKRVKRFT